MSNKNIDYFIANSKYVKKRIHNIYKRNSLVINPPVDTAKFTLKKNKKNFYLTASRLVPYKKIDLVIKAFNKLPNKTLYVIGKGPQFDNYKKFSKPNVKYLGFVNNKTLMKYMQNAKGFIFPTLEDFGIIPLEAQSCGTPVIAYGKGGSLETVINYPKSKATGIFFKNQNVSSILESIKKFEKNYKSFQPSYCRNNAKNFSKYVFKKEI